MSDNKKNIPFCPLMTAGNSFEKVCTQDMCAWYLKGYKVCSVYMLAHNAAMEVQAKQAKKQ
jgi:hypothetical protein